jgi:hypothetical protein
VAEGNLPTREELETARKLLEVLIEHFRTANQSIGQEGWIGLQLAESMLEDLANGMWGADKWY